MLDKIKELTREVQDSPILNAEDLEQFRIHYQGRKGILAGLFEEFKTIPPAQKKETGKILNDLKLVIQEKIDSCSLKFEVPSKKLHQLISTSPVLSTTWILAPGIRCQLSGTRSSRSFPV